MKPWVCYRTNVHDLGPITPEEIAAERRCTALQRMTDSAAGEWRAVANTALYVLMRRHP